MLDALSERLQKTFGRLGRGGRITEADLDAALREVRVALLEADVNFQVMRDFVARVRERALGVDVLQSITPGQQVIGIVSDELVAILGGNEEPLLRAESGPTKLLVCGVQGSGKTTLAARLALHLKKDGQKPLLVATDFPARRRLRAAARARRADRRARLRRGRRGALARGRQARASPTRSASARPRSSSTRAARSPSTTPSPTSSPRWPTRSTRSRC